MSEHHEVKKPSFDPNIYEFTLLSDPLNHGLENAYKGVKLSFSLAVAREFNNSKPITPTRELIDTALEVARNNPSEEKIKEETERFINRKKADLMEEHRVAAGYVPGIEASLPSGDRD